jgi:hypothetical protein
MNAIPFVMILAISDSWAPVFQCNAVAIQLKYQGDIKFLDKSARDRDPEDLILDALYAVMERGHPSSPENHELDVRAQIRVSILLARMAREESKGFRI